MAVLTDRQEKLLVLFKEAVQREKEAQMDYSDMLSLNDDPEVRCIIESFIRQEKQHEEILLRIYNELRTAGAFKDV